MGRTSGRSANVSADTEEQPDTEYTSIEAVRRDLYPGIDLPERQLDLAAIAKRTGREAADELLLAARQITQSDNSEQIT